MSTTNQTAEAFLEKLVTEDAFRGRVAAQGGSREALMAFVRSEGYQFDEAQLRDACEARFGSGGEALSDEALAEVSAGFDNISVKLFGIQLGIIGDGRSSKK